MSVRGHEPPSGDAATTGGLEFDSRIHRTQRATCAGAVCSATRLKPAPRQSGGVVEGDVVVRHSADPIALLGHRGAARPEAGGGVG